MSHLETVAHDIAVKHSLNPAVIKAMCAVESSWNTYAVRYEPKWKWTFNIQIFSKKVSTTEETEKVLQSCSWGLLQVMGTVARELGYTMDFPKLCNPELGLTYGCLKLKQCITKHINLPDALAAYNAGKPGTTAGIKYAYKVISQIKA